jgi:hypothetical protein
MKWETLKQKVASENYTQILTGTHRGDVILTAIFDSMAEKRPPRESLKALADTVYDRIMQWDIRCVEKLRELFLESFPKALQSGPLGCWMDNEGNWIVIRRT